MNNIVSFASDDSLSIKSQFLKMIVLQSDAANGLAVNGSTSNGIPKTSSNGHSSNGRLSEGDGAVRRRNDPVEK